MSRTNAVHFRRISDQDKKTFLLQEYDVLTKEIADQLAELWTIEKLAIGGSAALAAWLATHQLSIEHAWRLPFLFIAVCALRFGLGMLHK